MQLGKIEIDVPGDWEDRSLYTFVAPKEDVSPQMRVKENAFRKNVVIQRRGLGPEETLESCAEFLVSTTRETFGEIKIEVADGPTTLAFESRRVTYTVIDDVTQSAVGQVIYLCLMGHEEWQLAFSLPAINLSRDLPGLEKIVASLRATG